MIPETVLVLAGPFGERLGAGRVAGAIARGLTAGGRQECDVCALEEDLGVRTDDASKLLDAANFSERMRAARAVVIVCTRLDDRTLAGSVAFEAATRARQSGVPAYAVTAHNALDSFEARIVDLQLVLEADTARGLSAAAKELATLV
ncbi:MAG TPA: glycerate kinase [Solirubrobacteraceae bacterium]|nr:glycerate kinase [Solirubrobacteraceae bacterium]